MRAAIIGGGAYAVGKRSAQGDQGATDQGATADEPESQQAPAAPAGGLTDAAVDQLEHLGKLKEQGVLTDEEFAQQKKKLLQAT
jgi:hypothetical protein